MADPMKEVSAFLWIFDDWNSWCTCYPLLTYI